MTEPNLQFPAVFCENLRFLPKSAVFCGFRALQMLEFAGERVNLRKSAVSCENLCFGSSLSPCCSVPLSALLRFSKAAPSHYPKRWADSLDGQNRQSPIASVQRTQTTLASHSAVPCGTNVKRMNANHAIRIAAQRTQGL